MQLPNTFDIRLIKQIPYLTKVVYRIAIVCLIGLFLTSLYLLPARAAIDEMKVAYVILYVPKYITTIAFYSSIGLIISLSLYFHLYTTRSATLTFLPLTINIDGKQSSSIPINSIDTIYCSHIPATGRLRKETLKLRIDRIKDTSIYFRLTHNVQIDEFMTQLTNYHNIKLQLYNMDIGYNPDEA